MTTPGHGTRARYQRGCTCEWCQEANRAYQRQYQRPEPRVSAGPAIHAIKRLHRAGLSYEDIAELVGTSRRIIGYLLNGTTKTVTPALHHALQEARIADAPDEAVRLVDAAAAKRWVEWLQAERGMSTQEIIRRCGFRRKDLNIGAKITEATRRKLWTLKEHERRQAHRERTRRTAKRSSQR